MHFASFVLNKEPSPHSLLFSALEFLEKGELRQRGAEQIMEEVASRFHVLCVYLFTYLYNHKCLFCLSWPILSNPITEEVNQTRCYQSIAKIQSTVCKG